MGRLRGFFGKFTKAHICILVCLAFIAAFHLLTGCRWLMNAVSSAALLFKRLLARIFSLLPFSVMELMIAVVLIAVVVYIIQTVMKVISSENHLKILSRRLSLLLAMVLGIYALLCVLLGASYNADGFQEKSGLYAQKSSVEELCEVTEYFANRLSLLSDAVERDENGIFSEELDDIFSDSLEVYNGISGQYDFLGQPSVKPKRMIFSKIMSYFNYTGVYFPFTGEANINTDNPAMLIPATIAHEMAHQRGIASEQEANFVAVLACTLSGDPVYDYSGSLLAFINLGNALYKYDREAYYNLVATLPQNVLADMQANSEYWKQYENKASTVSEKVYDGFLKSYGQEMGVQSYGACVDLLIAYYNEYGEF